MTDRPVAQLRLATPDDAPALAAMHIASWREADTGQWHDSRVTRWIADREDNVVRLDPK